MFCCCAAVKQRQNNNLLSRNMQNTLHDSILDNELIALLSKINIVNTKLTSKYIPAHIKSKTYNIPNIIAVGSQSVGKSSSLNSLIGIPLLPTGESMVTRTPINIQIKQSMKQKTIKILKYTDYDCSVEFSAVIDDNYDFTQYYQRLRELTDLMVPQHDVCDTPIYIMYEAPNVQPLNIVDLPGIILTNKFMDQPDGLVDHIYKIIEAYVKIPNTYVAVCLQPHIDFETDPALSHIIKLKKQYKFTTIGIITKPDSINIDLFNVKCGKMISQTSGNLMMDKGYYVLNNTLTNTDDNWYINYFGEDSFIVRTGKYGINNIGLLFKSLLLSGTKDSIQVIESNMMDIKNLITEMKVNDGNELKTSTKRLLYITDHIFIANRILHDSIKSIGNIKNIGHDIKVCMDTLKKDLDNMNEFSSANLTDTELKEIILEFDGYRSNFGKNMTLVLNKCLANANSRPIQKLRKIIELRISEIIRIMKEFIISTYNGTLDIYPENLNYHKLQINRFTRIINLLTDLSTKILESCVNRAQTAINDQLNIIESETWLLYDDIDMMLGDIHTLISNTDNVDKKKLRADKLHQIQQIYTDKLFKFEPDNIDGLKKRQKGGNLPTTGRQKVYDINKDNGPLDLVITKSADYTTTINNDAIIDFSSSTKQNKLNNSTNSVQKHINNDTDIMVVQSVRKDKQVNDEDININDYIKLTRIILEGTYKYIVAQVKQLALNSIANNILKYMENKYFIDICNRLSECVDYNDLFYNSNEDKECELLLNNIGKNIDDVIKNILYIKNLNSV